jgi:hypothetical protein
MSESSSYGMRGMRQEGTLGAAVILLIGAQMVRDWNMIIITSCAIDVAHHRESIMSSEPWDGLLPV